MLTAARQALRLPCCVPIDQSALFNRSGLTNSALVELCKTLATQAEAAHREGRNDSAFQEALDVLDLATHLYNGGSSSDHAIGYRCLNFGICAAERTLADGTLQQQQAAELRLDQIRSPPHRGRDSPY